jgi:hypothetical protein
VAIAQQMNGSMGDGFERKRSVLVDRRWVHCAYTGAVAQRSRNGIPACRKKPRSS